MLGRLLKNYVEKHTRNSFMKTSYNRDIALAGINMHTVNCNCCGKNDWIFIEKPVNGEVKLVCRVCGSVRFFLYGILYSNVNKAAKAAKAQADKAKDGALANATPAKPAPTAPTVKKKGHAEAIRKHHKSKKEAKHGKKT